MPAVPGPIERSLTERDEQVRNDEVMALNLHADEVVSQLQDKGVSCVLPGPARPVALAPQGSIHDDDDDY